MDLKVMKSSTSGYTTDASPSWNGYNHQGKVGIYVVLKMINELQLDKESSKKYELELEWLEDFSIKVDGKYKFIHQVKTYNESGPANYKDAIWSLLAKTLDIEEVNYAYLHVTKALSRLENLKENLLTYTAPIENKKDPDGSDDSEVTLGKKRKYFTPKECHDYVKKSGKYDEVFNKFKLYNYGENSQHCTMDEIEAMIKNELETILGDTATLIHLDRAYYQLLGLVDRNIRERHNSIQRGENEEKVTINFENIYIIATTNYEIFSKEYASYYLKNHFNYITRDYLDELCMEEQEGLITNDDIKKIKAFMDSLNLLDENQFIEFCLKITPDNEINRDHPDHIIKMLSACLYKTSMSDGFFEIIKKIKIELDFGKVVYIKKQDEQKTNLTYLPSAIIDDNHPIRNKKLAKRIVSNANPELLNEIDIIITKSINLDKLDDDKIHKNIPDPNILKDSVIEQEENYYQRISKIKSIRLIDMNNAEGELN
ncbi:ABC-three component system protein [Paenisporosarcina sp. NPDC076898]|uniref:ABC-three component system protein n=1 Tax=unclassified Paenisporosarcina TaxID=2642018 RepID=UPI003D069F7A